MGVSVLQGHHLPHFLQIDYGQQAQLLQSLLYVCQRGQPPMVDVRGDAQVVPVALLAYLDRLIERVDRHADPNLPKHPVSRLGIEAHAAVRGRPADAGERRGAVKSNLAAAPAHPPIPQRVTRTGRNQRPPSAFPAYHRFRGLKDWILDLALHLERAGGSGPGGTPDGGRIARQELPVTEYINAAFGNIQDAALLRLSRQDKAGGQQQPGAWPGPLPGQMVKLCQGQSIRSVTV